MSSDFADYSVKNYYSIRKNNPLLPSSIRACIIGKSGCGKTNLLMNLLLDKFEGDDYLDYDNLYIFSTTLFQPCYQALINGFENGLSKKDIRECFKNQNFMVEKKDKQEITICTSDSLDDIPDPCSIDPNKKTLIIFDDLMLEKQNKIEQYYTRGRHNNIDCFYISQSYIKLPKNTIRENANFFIVFPQDKLNLDYIYRDHCSELDKERFLEMSSEMWKDQYSFLTIDKTSELLMIEHSVLEDNYDIVTNENEELKKIVVSYEQKEDREEDMRILEAKTEEAKKQVLAFKRSNITYADLFKKKI
ncbi:Protein CBG24594 [Caenorhabditis briggsae]|uniref:Protein CBG24594 n=1 Tax=Caenorhabditis briggsae TaxID=6238 RepID=A8WL18_CAEBR|nr:Protein CBG24594 [Caenorhabditis briggsae]CAP21163.2 Protein CBG24594 [Caenorhabditis briggsae]